jgi:hypothetical protein
MNPTPKYPSLWSYWPDPADRDYMRSWLAKISLVCESSGTVLDAITQRTTTEFQIEASIRDWIYWNFKWTGIQQPDPPAGLAVNSPRPLLEWYDRIGHDKAEWSCGPLNCVKVGLLAACGIPARLCWSSHYETAAVDIISEFWSESAQQWILTSPQLNTHFMFQGRFLSFYDWAIFDRSQMPVQHCTISGQGAPRNYPDNFQHWRKMSGNPCIQSGNFNQGGTAIDSTRKYLQLMPRIGAAADLESVLPYPDSQPSIFGSPQQLALP